MSYRVTRNTEYNYVPMEGGKNGSLAIRLRIWLGNIFPISCDNNLGIKFWVKNAFEASYSRAAIALKMC